MEVRDGIDILIDDHRRCEDLFARLDAQPELGAETLHELIRTLSVHDALESRYLYPLVSRRLDNGVRRTWDGVHRQAEIAGILGKLDRQHPDDPYRHELLGSVAGLVREHVAQEEGELFPELRDRLAPEELVRLGQALDSGRAKAPTRPHPHTPRFSIGTKLAAATLRPIDRARDALGRRPSAVTIATNPGKRVRRNLYACIERDHRYIERLMAQLEADPSEVNYDGPARKKLASYLVVAASRHEAAEEIVLWPAVRKRVPTGPALADEGLRQEHDAKFMLDVLTVGSPGPGIAEFILAARAHMAFEEQQALPALRKVTSRPGAWLLGIKFATAKRITPTRPHPYGPDRRFGLVTKGALTAGLDHLRDRLTGRDAS